MIAAQQLNQWIEMRRTGTDLTVLRNVQICRDYTDGTNIDR